MNSQQQYIASMPSEGFLSAHLNLSDRPKSGETKRRIRIVGHDTSLATENVSIFWPDIELALGDVVELAVLEDGIGSPPSSIRRSSQDQGNLFASNELAAEALAIGHEFEKKILSLLQKAEMAETGEEAKKIRLATGHLIAALGEHLFAPIWRRHSDLVPPEMKGELL
ncbi:hypothetical protein [Dyella choica]|uniref:Uncharacterized protein n=1 Tax=Dyella choica TaxID=1927959 RepID=A0A3S0PFU3_9GAMM|nr:hypothetical protein [Dyella choica]RUL70507.1 hypothetical protein EKH80_20115 [Dyella choica]